MSIAQPASSDFLNSPDHSLLHRIIAADVAAPVESIAVDSTGKTTLNAIAATTVNGLALSLGTNSIAGNVAVGYQALNGANSGNGLNVAVGYQSLVANTSGDYNVAVGRLAMSSNLTGTLNTAVGTNSLLGTIGNYNVALGYNAGFTTTGNNNTFIGTYAGKYETGSSSFYVDGLDRTNTAGDKAGALLYGTFNATPASQTLRVNASLSVLGLAGTGSRAVLADANGLLSAPVSDERLKTNITPIDSQTVMDMLKDPKIQAINYTWRDESKGSDVELGLTYQMLEPHHIKGLTFYDNEVGGINYDRLCVILWEQNKELLKRIEKLEQN